MHKLRTALSPSFTDTHALLQVMMICVVSMVKLTAAIERIERHLE